MPPFSDNLSVICFCAEWCGTCREYRAGFERLAAQFPGVAFSWWDIEDDARNLGNLEIENFPMLLARRQEWILFFGALPQAEHLRRLIDIFVGQTPEQSRDYALSSPERQAWQTDPDLACLEKP